MIFRQCTIGGVAYRGEPDPPTYDEDDQDDIKVKSPSLSEGKEKSETLAIPVQLEYAASSSQSVTTPLKSSSSDFSNRGDDDETPHFYDHQLRRDLDDAMNAEQGSANASHARNLHGFFTVLSLCHTVLTAVDPETGEISYKAQSPDEGALVQAAADVGYQFVGRDRETLLLRTPGSTEVEKYELLNILEFTSARKRMSVVVRRLDVEDHRPMLLAKGADNVIFERLRAGNDEMKEQTESHLSEFANTGLRTLTLAYKIIPGESHDLLPFEDDVFDCSWQRRNTPTGASDTTKRLSQWKTGRNG